MTKISKTRNFAPALTLMFLSPMIAELLPGATRFSSIFVLPIEILVWGGGALMIRYATRKWKLGWTGMLFLAIALSVAEEFLIQQTSVAPLIIQIKGVIYARAFGINYVYLAWALIYEPVMVVLVPVCLTELLFPGRRKDAWLGKAGLVSVMVLFLIGCFFAWFTWTRIARPKVFHQPEFTPPLTLVLAAIAVVIILIILAFRRSVAAASKRQRNFHLLSPLALGISGGLWSVILYAIVLLAFGIMPSVPPIIALLTALLLAIVPLNIIPSWVSGPYWNDHHSFGLISGIITGSMIAGFAGFIGSLTTDLIFKAAINVLAIAGLILLGLKIRAASVPGKQHSEDSSM
jgi:hypothetical protein